MLEVARANVLSHGLQKECQHTRFRAARRCAAAPLRRCAGLRRGAEMWVLNNHVLGPVKSIFLSSMLNSAMLLPALQALFLSSNRRTRPGARSARTRLARRVPALRVPLELAPPACALALFCPTQTAVGE